MQSFFEMAFGFVEEGSYATTQQKLLSLMSSMLDPELGGNQSVIQFRRPSDGAVMQAGCFEVVSLAELRDRALKEMDGPPGGAVGGLSPPLPPTCGLEHIVGESRALHSLPETEGCVIQAASQFNCLEFPSPHNTPEEGITQYMWDRTQGPACAIACPLGTAVRNYLHRMEDGRMGQTAENQINTLVNFTQGLGGDYYTVRNGYIDSTNEQLIAFSQKLSTLPPVDVDKLRDSICIGVQWRTQVLHPSGELQHLVTQTYNSACSVSYSRRTNPENWKPLACIILEASYEATLWVAVLENLRRARVGKCARPCLLTKVGGGVFGNEPEWIKGAVARARQQIIASGATLQCQMVHYGRVEDEYTE